MSFSILSVKVRRIWLRHLDTSLSSDSLDLAYFPSTIRLVLLDLVIATLQFVVLIVAFGEAIRPESPTTAESTDNAPEGEDNRTVEELSALLGEEFEEDETEIVASAFPPSPRVADYAS